MGGGCCNAPLRTPVSAAPRSMSPFHALSAPSCSSVTSAVRPLPTWVGVASEVKLVREGTWSGGDGTARGVAGVL